MKAFQKSFGNDLLNIESSLTELTSEYIGFLVDGETSSIRRNAKTSFILSESDFPD